MAEAAAVVLDAVTYRYPGGKAGIFDLSMTIEPGELAVCIGPSGCGKTTLLKLIAGFFQPDSGRVLIGGRDMSGAPVRARECGIVFQSYALFPQMRVWENVAYPLRVRGIAVPARRRRADEALELVGLAGMGERLPAQLSGGQQQRVALARALVFEPQVLLLDEPLSALDAATRVTMRDELRRIQQVRKVAALLITHDQDEALSLADRIAVLRDGRLIQYADPHTVYDRPANGFVADFVGRANVLAGTAASSDSVDTPIGRLRTAPHGAATGAPLRLLIRPERIDVHVHDGPVDTGNAGDAVIDNVFDVQVVRDRFFGSSRQLLAKVGQGQLEIETAVRGAVRRIAIGRDAIQFVGEH